MVVEIPRHTADALRRISHHRLGGGKVLTRLQRPSKARVVQAQRYACRAHTVDFDFFGKVSAIHKIEPVHFPFILVCRFFAKRKERVSMMATRTYQTPVFEYTLTKGCTEYGCAFVKVHTIQRNHVEIGVNELKKHKENKAVIHAVEAHHGDVEPTGLISCIVQAADTISAARPGARRETLETYTTRLKQLEEITNSFKGVSNSYAIQAGREVRVMVVPEQINDADMVLLARDISKKIENEMEYPGQIKVSVIRESRVTDFAK
jgi:hypothetical protein